MRFVTPMFLTLSLVACGTETPEIGSGTPAADALHAAKTTAPYFQEKGNALALSGLGDLTTISNYLAANGYSDYQPFNAGGEALLGVEVDHYSESPFGPNTDGECIIFLNKVGDNNTPGPEGEVWINNPTNGNSGLIQFADRNFGGRYDVGLVTLTPCTGLPTDGAAYAKGAEKLSLHAGTSSLPVTTGALDIAPFQVSPTKILSFTLDTPNNVTRSYDPSVDSYTINPSTACGQLFTQAGFQPFEWQQITDMSIVMQNKPQSR